MTFIPKAWQNYPTATTPIDAAALIDVETRLAGYADALLAAGGPVDAVDASTYTAKVGTTYATVADALNQADTDAVTQGRPVFLPPGTYTFTKALFLGAAWYGIPRKSILRKDPAFTYGTFNNQFSIQNKSFARAYNSATAAQFYFAGIDLVVEISSGDVGGKGGIGLGNVSGGRIFDCVLTTFGARSVDSLVDLYAAHKNMTVEKVRAINNTGDALGGALFVRNYTTDGTVAANAGEGTVIKDSYFASNTQDEALTVFGGLGLVRQVHIQNCKVEALPSPTRTHQAVFTVYAGDAISGNINGGVQDVTAVDCQFFDVNETCIGSPVRIGYTGDTGKCQSVRLVRPRVYARTNVVNSTQTVIWDIGSGAFDGGFTGNEVIEPYVNTTGSSQRWSIAVTSPRVVSPTIVGGAAAPTNGCGWCSLVEGGNIEAYNWPLFNCKVVNGGRHKVVNPSVAAPDSGALKATGDFGDLDWRNVSCEGGASLYSIGSGVPTTRVIKLLGCRITTTATSGNYGISPSSTPPRIELIGNTINGPTSLTRTGGGVVARHNSAYGKLDGASGRNIHYPAPWPNGNYAPAAGQVRGVLWAPLVDTYVSKLAFVMFAAGTSDEQVELMVFDAVSDTKLYSSGLVTGVTNTTTPAPKAMAGGGGWAYGGGLYYLAYSLPTLPTGTPTIACYKTDASVAVKAGKIAGSTLGTQEYFSFAGAGAITSLAPGMGTDTTVIPFVAVLSS